MQTKERLDILLVKLGYAPSREKAKAMILSGEVYVNGERQATAGDRVEESCQIEVKSNQLKYVSRGGFKLEKALEDFDIDVCSKICIDIGASTGGFTDCLLQKGAKMVYAVDVGYGQLDWKLRNDDRVRVLEKTNARYLNADILGNTCDFAVADVSFISLDKILPIFMDILKEEGEALCLIKPQFECGRKYVNKNGVVKERFVHEYVINKTIDNGSACKLYTKDLTYSPIKGPKGNIEYLIHLVKYEAHLNKDVKELVEEAFINL